MPKSTTTPTAAAPKTDTDTAAPVSPDGIRPRAPRPGAARRARSRAASTRAPRQLAAARHRAAADGAVSDPLTGVLPVFDGAYSEQAFLNRLGAAGWRTESRAVAVCEVYSFAGWLAAGPAGGAPLHVRQVTPQHIAAYRDHLLDHGLSVSTTRLALVCLRLYFDFLTEEDDDAAANPARGIALPDRDLPATCPYTEAEVTAIFAHLTDQAWQAWDAGDTTAWLTLERDYAMLMVLHYTGLRRGELRRMRIRDLAGPGQLKVRGKGGKPRTITVPSVLTACVDRYLTLVRGTQDPDAFVFCELDEETSSWVSAGADADRADHRYLTDDLADDARGEDADYGLGPYTLTDAAHRHGRAAGVQGPHYAHRWRHTHCSRYAEAGSPLGGLASRMGHDIEARQHGVGWNPITLDYIHLSVDYLHRVVNEALTDPLST